MIRILHFTPDGRCHTGVTPDALPSLLANQEGLLWIDMSDSPSAEAERLLSQTFGFHPLAIDDTLNELNVPKLVDWGAYLYIVIQGVIYEEEAQGILAMSELDTFIGANYLVTYHEGSNTAVERVWETSQRDERIRSHGPDHLFYRIAEEQIDDYIAVLDRMEDSLDQIEHLVFTGPNQVTLSQIFVLKRRLLQLRRLVVPQREVFNKLARDEFGPIARENRIFFRDLYDHMLRLYDLMESLRDMVSGAMEIYLSVINNRMNDIMKTLTVITVFFMPLTFITGFFGMNFFQPVIETRLWTDWVVLVGVLALMVLIPVIMYWWMRRRAWM